MARPQFKPSVFKDAVKMARLRQPSPIGWMILILFRGYIFDSPRKQSMELLVSSPTRFHDMIQLTQVLSVDTSPIRWICSFSWTLRPKLQSSWCSRLSKTFSRSRGRLFKLIDLCRNAVIAGMRRAKLFPVESLLLVNVCRGCT